MKKWNKILSTAAATAIVISLLAGCGTGAADTGGDAGAGAAAGTTPPAAADAGAAAADGPMTPVGTLPIVAPGHDVTFRVFLTSTERAPDFYDNDFTRFVTEETGVNFTFEQPRAVDAVERLNLLFAAGDYPDIAMGGIGQTISRVMMNSWALQGMIIPLDDLIARYAPNTTAFLNEDPLRRYPLLAGDGHIFAMPGSNECLHCYTDRGMLYYYAGFRNIMGFDVPQTLDEFTNILRRIRDENVNGSDQHDEIPLLVRQNQIFHLVNVFANSFFPMATTEQYGLTLINDVPVAQLLQPEAREVFRYLNMLFEEGLINDDFMSLTDSEPLAESEVPIVGFVLGGHTNSVFVRPSATARWTLTRAVPALVGPTGIGYAPQNGTFGSSFVHSVITDVNPHPEIAVRLIDWMYNLEVGMSGYIGPRGEAWDWPEPGALGINGEPALFRLLVGYGTQRVGGGWDQQNPTLRTATVRLGEQATDVDRIMDFIYNPTQAEALELALHPSFNEINNFWQANRRLANGLPDQYNIPPITFTVEESQRIAEIRAVADPFFEQMRAEFIAGMRCVDNDWDTFVGEMQRMGSDEYVEIFRNALARQFPDRFS